ncbi:MAG: hypothetical protein U9P90_02980 [Patescibacteria group bacterium]|nr:hypothetical protein [Patescibacteria group bacterium]
MTKEYKYPDPEYIRINEADLKLHLINFAKANKSKITIRDLIILIPAWAVLFTADFKLLFGLDPVIIKSLYAGLLIFGTAIYFNQFFWSLRRLYNWLKDKIFFNSKKKKNIILSEYCENTAFIADPTKKVESVKEISRLYKLKK